MALMKNVHSETICDLEGAPLHPDGVALLKSLDKLLTLGAYYSSDHDQYRLASQEAAAAIREAIGGRRYLALEITSEGLVILGQCLDPAHRHVRQLHDLLVPLNIARLEIDAQLEAANLRQALQVLHEHKLSLGKASSFQEIVIEGLPSCIRSVSRKVLQDEAWTETREPDWQAPEQADKRPPEHERLAREFMELVTRVLEDLERREAAGEFAGGVEGVTPVSRRQIQELKAALRRLVEFKPSPRDLVQLIAHARSALDLSRDPRRTDLVFQILRKDILEKFGAKRSSVPSRPKPVKYRMEIEQLAEAIADLENRATEVQGPEEGSVRAHMAVCLALLADDPNEAMHQSVVDSLAQVFADRGFRDSDLEVCRAAVAEALDSGFPEWTGKLVTNLSVALRRGRPQLIGTFWRGVREEARNEDLLVLWPYLLNDLLLGMGTSDAAATRDLLLWAGQLTPETALTQVPRLREQPAMRARRVVGDLFKLPLALLYPVHLALSRTRLRRWLSRGLYASMRARPFNPVVKALVATLEFDPENLDFYLELVHEAGQKQMSPELANRCATLLLGMLENLPPGRRREGWVPAALEGLGQLQVAEARPFLSEVLRARRWMILPAWPTACREVARFALNEAGPSAREGDHG